MPILLLNCPHCKKMTAGWFGEEHLEVSSVLCRCGKEFYLRRNKVLTEEEVDEAQSEAEEDDDSGDYSEDN